MKVALVTGAGKGMGAACARELAARGWGVALLSPSGAAEKLAAELGGIGVTGSVVETADLQRLADAAMAHELIERHAANGKIILIP